MKENNGFKVNIDFNQTENNKKRILKSVKQNYVIAVAVVLVLLIIFLAVVPVCSEYHISKRVSTDKNGNITEINYYDDDLTVMETEKYQNGEKYCVVKNIYKNGNITEIQSYYFETLFETEKFEYDKDKKISRKVYDSEDVLKTTELFNYDEKGTLINSIITDGEGIQKYRYDYTYKDGLLTEKIMYYTENDYTNVTTYTYDNGRLISENVTAGAYHNKTTEYSYNSKGLVSLKKSDSGDNEYVFYTYEYVKTKISVFKKIF